VEEEAKGEGRDWRLQTKNYMEEHKRKKLKSRDGQMLHNEWVGFHECGKGSSLFSVRYKFMRLGH
jgi:hypothetical protein